jgi:hypothetical protein
LFWTLSGIVSLPTRQSTAVSGANREKQREIRYTVPLESQTAVLREEYPMPDIETQKSGSVDSSSQGIRNRFHKMKETLEAGGIDFPGVGTILYLWRKLGFKGMLLVILLVGFPLGQYSLLRSAVYSALPGMIGGFGLEFYAEDWSLEPLSLRATARNVRIHAPSDEKPALTAGDIEFQGSVETFLYSFFDMVTFHLFGLPQPFNKVTVRHGEIHLERSLTGHLNWSDFIEAVPQTRVDEAVQGIYQVNALVLEDLRISYIEHIQGGSGDGIIRTAEAQVKIDEMRGQIVDLIQPKRSGERPTRFNLRGRSADGVFEISGNVALFPPKSGAPKPPRNDDVILATAGRQDSQVSALPGRPFELSIYLENIAAGAYGKMVPVTTIIPVNGVIAGRAKVVSTGVKPECEGNFTLKDVRFAPNALILTKVSDFEAVRTKVEGFSYSGPFELCGTKLETAPAPDRSEPPASTMLVSLTEQATSDASPAVKALVSRDRQILRGEHPAITIEQLTNAAAQEVVGRVAGSVANKIPGGNTASAALQDENTTTSLTKGVKSVGNGIKRLFGRKKDKN